MNQQPSSIASKNSEPKPIISSADRFKRKVTLLMAGLTFLGTVVAALKVNSGGHAATAGRDGRTAVVKAVGKGNAGALRYMLERNFLSDYQALVTLASLEKSLALEQLSLAEARHHMVSAERYDILGRDLTSYSELLSPAYRDPATGVPDVFKFGIDYLVRPPAKWSEMESAKSSVAGAWGKKDDRYQVTLTTLAVCLLLLGLTFTIGDRLKNLFVVVSLSLALGAFIWAAATVLLPVPRLPESAIQAYVDGAVELYSAGMLEAASSHREAIRRAEQAISYFDKALTAGGGTYASAIQARGAARLIKAQALLFSGGVPVRQDEVFLSAVSDLEKAVSLGGSPKQIYPTLAWAGFLAKKYPESIRAAEQALALAPELQFQFGLTIALSLLGQGREAEAAARLEQALAFAEKTPLASDSLNFRETIRSLDLWIAVRPLDGIRSFQKRLKEAFASLQFNRTIHVKPTKASLGPLEFALPLKDSGGSAMGRTSAPDFPLGTPSVDCAFTYEGMTQGSQFVQKIYCQGREVQWLNRAIPWSHGPTGRYSTSIQSPIEKARIGLNAGLYKVEFYVDGNLLRSGEFRID